MIDTIILAFLGLLLVANIICWISIKKLAAGLGSLRNEQNRMENALKQEFSINREEGSTSSRSLREEVTKNIQERNKDILASFDKLREAVESKLEKMSKENQDSRETLRTAVESKLKNIQENNERQLDKMRTTVDEKLQSTLERRLSESFKQVDSKLGEVHRGLGEMKDLASGVGDLKKVLTNVKSRGTWGEFQLGNILEEILTPEQYEKNVSVKGHTSEVVEYAVKLPGQGLEKGVSVYLPIDSKFPQEDYQRLLDAQERANPELVAGLSSKLEATIKREARKIRDKYIAPPATTDFAIMFLPTEGLYAEVLRIPGLAEFLQRDCRVVITGPTHFAALLNSLSVGFRTLAIQKRSSEVWKLLGAIKSQFGTFSNLLDNVQKKLDGASREMEKASKRSRTIEKKLIKVEELPDDTQAMGFLAE